MWFLNVGILLEERNVASANRFLNREVLGSEVKECFRRYRLQNYHIFGRLKSIHREECLEVEEPTSVVRKQKGLIHTGANSHVDFSRKIDWL